MSTSGGQLSLRPLRYTRSPGFTRTCGGFLRRASVFDIVARKTIYSQLHAFASPKPQDESVRDAFRTNRGWPAPNLHDCFGEPPSVHSFTIHAPHVLGTRFPRSASLLPRH